jgi:hypothetical protein
MGLLVSIPVYYYYRIDAIIPTMIIIIKLIFCLHFIFKKNRNSKNNLTIKELLLEGKGIVKLGVY